MTKYIEVTTKDGYDIINKGKTGHDQYSSECCPKCYSEKNDYGIVSSFYWNEEKIGWDQIAGCNTCGHYYKEFIPYTE